tara:strand:+ start:1122 stop:2105 length:984 start_codon:yes stop_codon:yes gene_type:complete
MLSKLTFLLNRLIVVLRIERKQLPVFLFLFTLSTLFWILTVLSKDYTTTIHYKADFVNLPDDKLLIEDKNPDLHLQVMAPGFTILAHHLSFRKHLPLSVSTFIPKKKGNNWNYYWLAKQSISQLQDLLPANMQLLHVQPNRIDVLLDEKYERVIPIQIKKDLSFKDLFRQKGAIKLDPSTIVISGPKAVVEVFSSISTENLKIDDINSSCSGTISIEPLNHSELNYSLSQVNWELSVEQYTEGEIKLPLSIMNVPENYKIKLFPDEVAVKYLVSLDKFDLVKKDMFLTNIIFDNTKKRLPIELVRQADFIENIRLKPEKVEYFLIKK